MREGPVFIVGSPRSGTSIVYLALKQVTRLPGHHEGHFLGLYGGLRKVLAHHYRLFAARARDPRNTIAHIPEREMQAALVRLLLETCNRVHGGTSWIDKSAGVPMLDFIQALAEEKVPFSTIFMYRRSLENVVSRLKKFPNHDLRYHAQDWVNIMAVWRRVRERLPRGSYAEVEQKEIVDDPDAIGRRIAQLLRLGEPKQRAMARIFSTRRPQQLASERLGRVLTLDGVGWSAEQRALFEEIVKDEMGKWHFTNDERYRLTGAAARLPKKAVADAEDAET